MVNFVRCPPVICLQVKMRMLNHFNYHKRYKRNKKCLKLSWGENDEVASKVRLSNFFIYVKKPYNTPWFMYLINISRYSLFSVQIQTASSVFSFQAVSGKTATLASLIRRMLQLLFLPTQQELLCRKHVVYKTLNIFIWLLWYVKLTFWILE